MFKAELAGLVLALTIIQDKAFWAQPGRYYYWTEAYTRQHVYLDSLPMEICMGYPIVEVGLGDSVRRHKAVLSLGGVSYLSPEVLKNYPGLRQGSPRAPHHHLLAPADLPITTLMEVTVGAVVFEGVDAFVADAGLNSLLRACHADLVLGCNFLSAAVWAFYPTQGLAVVSSHRRRLRFPSAHGWEGRWQGKLWSPFLKKKLNLGDTLLVVHPEFSFGQKASLELEAATFKKLLEKGRLRCPTDGQECGVQGMDIEAHPTTRLYHAYRKAGSQNEAVMTDLLNRRIYLAKPTH